MISKYFYMAAMVVVLGLSGILTWALLALSNARAENQLLSAKLVTCSARMQNILEDKNSDRAIDNLSPDDLRHVPPDWLLPPPGGGN